MKCPLCRADNVAGPLCRRCKTDLSLLFHLEAQRKDALDRALEYGRAGDWPRLVAFADRADALRRDDDSRHLLALGHLMSRDFARAWAHARPANA
jgi:hypothetical protein